MSAPVIHKLGSHWQAGTNNAAGAGVVSHTDYIHPVYGYSRFDGHLPEGFCRVKAEEAFKRSQRRFPS